MILVNAEFVPVLEQIWDRVDPGKRLVLLDDGAGATETRLDFVAEYEALLAASNARFEFPELDENTRATTFYTTGTTGLPKGVYFSHRQLVLHTLAARGALAGEGQGRFNEGDVYMPITPMFHVHAWGIALRGHDAGREAGLPRALCSRAAGRPHGQREQVTFSHCVPTILQSMLNEREGEAGQPGRLDRRHRGCGARAGARLGKRSRWASTSSPATACRRPGRC